MEQISPLLLLPALVLGILVGALVTAVVSRTSEFRDDPLGAAGATILAASMVAGFLSAMVLLS